MTTPNQALHNCSSRKAISFCPGSGKTYFIWSGKAFRAYAFRRRGGCRALYLSRKYLGNFAFLERFSGGGAIFLAGRLLSP
jgi:hypothetical protein